VDDRRLVAETRVYYDRRAPDYGDTTTPDRAGPVMLSSELITIAIEQLAPAGDVLELACGPGAFTRALAPRVRSLTAVDASPAMLERNRGATTQPNVTYVEADVFEWRPPSVYDFVFFGFWLSHVPPGRFDQFWELVASCLGPNGRVGFVDEDRRGAHFDEVRVVDGTPVATRTLRDGTQYDVVKVFWDAADLEHELESLGWAARVEPFGDAYLLGSAGRLSA
jgi:demethylmenaquinone methyltransferase/2-methoxy-6-polyprenyl-1,4-benzoquinol methylase